MMNLVIVSVCLFFLGQPFASADDGAEETVGQGATALMLDAILKDSSVRLTRIR